MSFGLHTDWEKYFDKIPHNRIYDLYGGFVPYESLVFPGGEPHVKLNVEDIQGKYLYIFSQLTSPADFMELCILIDAISRCKPARLGLFCPYFPGARQDRATPGTALTAKVYAQILSTMHLDKLVIVDPHSDVVPALINCEIISSAAILASLAVRYDCIICPDAGASKRCYAVAERLGIKHIISGAKHRDVNTGKLSGFSIERLPVRSGRYLVVDDICDGGGTFEGLAQAFYADVNANGCGLDLYVSHGIFSKGLDGLLKYYNNVITTNSLPQIKHDKLTVYDLKEVADFSMRSIAR